MEPIETWNYKDIAFKTKAIYNDFNYWIINNDLNGITENASLYSNQLFNKLNFFKLN